MIPGPNWSRRYGARHRRMCARAGCGAPAAATLRFMPTQREAWLVDLDDAGARTEGDLCNRHATALVLPRGWELHDERTRVDTERDDIPVPKRSTRARRRPLVAVPARRTFHHPELELELASVLDDAVPEARVPEATVDESTIIEVETAIVLEPEPEASVDVAFEATVGVEPATEAPEAEAPEAEAAEPEVEADEPEPEPEPEADDVPPEASATDEVDATAPDKGQPSAPLPTPEGLADVLDARTPLLRRAFQNVWPFDEPKDED